jgi:hypothetical protein
MKRVLWLSLLVFFCTACPAFSNVALLLEEPYGDFGFLNPTGHAAIYLSNVCADSPTHLRRCAPGENGIVISRYRQIAGYDWLAIPLIPYLYAVDTPSEIPATVDRKTEAALRDAWRRKHLEGLIPDRVDGEAPSGNWTELVGALYDRKMYAYEISTTAAQDDGFIVQYNRNRNRSRFNLFFNNCADFSRRVLDFYYPRSVHRSFSADLGMTTPKQIAKSLVHYSARHERMNLEEFTLAQVPGSIPRSKHVDGVLEAMLRKKYVAPLVLLHPYVAAGLAVSYFTGGRFNPAKNSVTLEPAKTAPSLRLDEPLVPARPPRLALDVTAADWVAPESAGSTADAIVRAPAASFDLDGTATQAAR